MARLKRVDCSSPGIRRRKSGKGFTNLDQNENKIVDETVLTRIRTLAIPPAWSDVWICVHPMGHIQAVGLDARGRKQYRYHDVWLCCAVRLLDLGFFRIGTEGYAEENQTYGLATIRKSHVKEATGGDFSAKDFRTWSATVLAAVALAVSSGVARSESGRKRAIARAMKEVATYLGNTPAVCRSSYVDPRVVDYYTGGATVMNALACLDEESGLGGLHTHGAIEKAVLALLSDEDAATPADDAASAAA